MEVRMLEVPGFCVCITSEDALLQVGYLVESIHVQLANKGCELLVLEPPPKHFTSKLLVIENYCI